MNRRTRGPLCAALLLAGLTFVGAPSRDAGGTVSFATPAWAQRRDIVLIGDSTTYGTAEQSAQSSYQPGTVLQLLLRRPQIPSTSPWRRARVTNLAVSASVTQYWLDLPPTGCGSLLEVYAVPARACRDGTAWVDAVVALRPTVDLVVLQLGLNDYLATNDPMVTVDHLEQIVARLPVPVLVFPPIGPGAWAVSVRNELEARGLAIPSSYPSELPTWDGIHPTDGGYAAMAGLWLDRILKQP